MSLEKKTNYDNNLSSNINFSNIKVNFANKSCIAFHWEFSKTFDVFKIIKQNRDLWETVYWGRKKCCTVENLEQNVCYSFIIHVLVEAEDKFICIESSGIFKAATANNPTFKSFDRAVSKSQVKVVKEYLKIVPHYINIPNHFGLTPLGIAVNNEDENMVLLLLLAGADVNIGLCTKRTPLHIAVFKGFLNIANILIANKADIRARDEVGLNIAHYAVDSDNIESLMYCLEKGIHTELKDNYDTTLILRAVITNASLEIIRLLLEKKCNTTVRDKNKLSVLYHARCLKKNDNLVEMLLNYKPKNAKHKQKISKAIQQILLSRKMKIEESNEDQQDEMDEASKIFEEFLIKE